VTIEEGWSRDTTLTLIEGAMYKQGWRKFGPLGSLMVNDKARNVCELERPAVLTYAGEIKEVHEIQNLIKNLWGINEQGQLTGQVFPLLLVAYDYSDDVKNFIMQTRVQGNMPIAALKAPFDGSPNARTQMLEDLAVLLGGQVTARGIIDLAKVTDAHLGCAEKVTIWAEEVVFYQGHGSEDDILARVDDLKTQLETTAYDYDKQNLRFRIGKLSGGIAVIRAGGSSEIEIVEKKDRIEDALCAAKVAVAEGILPGGGSSLYGISRRMTETSVAHAIMKEALQAPIKRIIENVGEEPASILTQLEKGYVADGLGYDARKKEFVDLMDSGIVDPLKVTKAALENAVSIVGLLLTIGGAVVNDDDSKDGMPNPLAGLLG
jgi:chaperonin GroEL